MARRRMIDPNFWTSEDMSKLTARQRLLFIGIFSNADDAGRIRGKSAYIRSTVFPYDDIELSEVEKDLQAIEAVGSLVRYDVDGGSYIQVNNWKKFQTIDRPHPSILPPQDSTSNRRIGSESIGEQIANDSLPIEEKLREEKLKEKKDMRGDLQNKKSEELNLSDDITFLAEEFESKFWEVYPSRDGKKLGKDIAFKKFLALKEEERQLVCQAVKNFSNSKMVKDGFGIMDPFRFFKSRDYPNGIWREWLVPDNPPPPTKTQGVAGAVRNMLEKRIAGGKYDRM